MNDTVILFMSTHGDTLADRNVSANSRRLFGRFGPYEEIVHVPLIVKIPGREGRRVEGMVSLIDVMPTIVEGLGGSSQVSRTMQGESFADLFYDERGFRERVFFESYVRNVRGIVRGQWKYFQRPGGETWLFNLEKDPDESNDLSRDRKAKVDHFQELLQEWELRIDRFEERKGE